MGLLGSEPDLSLCLSCVALAVGCSLDEARSAVDGFSHSTKDCEQANGTCVSCGRSTTVVRCDEPPV